MKNILITIIMIYVVADTQAQNYLDAARYSNTFPGVTARVLGAGSSFGSMGGDIGVVAINPAGIADYKKSEASFTFSFNQGNTISTLQGNPQSTDLDIQPSLDNIGFVFSDRGSSGFWSKNNFAVGLQQHSNLNENFAFSGNTSGSITERFIELSNTRTPDELDGFEAGPAYEVGAIYDFDEDGFYDADIDTVSLVEKSQTINRSGNVNEIFLALGGELTPSLKYGFGIGIPIISYEEDRSYFEQDSDDQIAFFDRLNFDERFTTSGWGVNLKLGLNYTIQRLLRIGLAYQSPSFYKLNDTYNTSVSYAYTVGTESERFESASPDGNFEYRFRTPGRITGSLGALLKLGDKMRGFVNIDAHYIDYKSNHFNFTAFSDNPSEAEFETFTNEEISNLLSSALNLNIGGELAFALSESSGARLRGGYAMLESPIESENTSGVLSFGAGYRTNKFYIDLAYQNRSYTSTHIPFSILNESRRQEISNDSDVSKISLTVGFKI